MLETVALFEVPSPVPVKVSNCHQRSGELTSWLINPDHVGQIGPGERIWLRLVSP